MTADYDWTPDRVAKLTKLWATDLTASEIGRTMGITKNAVVGKVRRLDLPARREVKSKSIIREPVTLDRLTNRACAYPFGDPKDRENFRFCAQPVQPGSSFCPHHHAICWMPVPNRKKQEAA